MVKIIDIRLDEISKDKVHRYFGYDDSNYPSDRTAAMMEEENRWLVDNAYPRGTYGIFPCELVSGGKVKVGSENFESVVLRLHMTGSLAAAVMAVTIGENVDTQISELMENGNMARGYILNGLASAAADCVVDSLENIIRDEIAHSAGCTESGDISGGCTEPGWKTTLRFSPGYAEFILENQRGIFNLIEPERIGINLNQSYLMKPLKSITAVIGIGPDVNTDEYPCELCDICNITNCKYIKDP